MIFKKPFALFSLLLLLACNSNSELKKIKNATFQSTYYHWVSGQEGGGTGLVFQTKFLLPETDVKSDSMWINDIALPAEITRVRDTVFANCFYFNAGNPMGTTDEERMPRSNFQKANQYAGKLRVYINGETKWITIKEFVKKQPPYLPM